MLRACLHPPLFRLWVEPAFSFAHLIQSSYGERAAALGEEFLGRYATNLIDVYADLAAIYGKMNKLGDAEAAARKCMLVATQKVLLEVPF